MHGDRAWLGIVTCVAYANPLPVGAVEVFTLTINISAALPTSFSLVNRAQVGGSTPDPNLDNNTAVEDTEVLARVALQVAKFSNPNPVVAGTRLTYTILVTNTGPADSTDTRMMDTLPFGTHLVSATAGNGGFCNTGVLCLLGTLRVGEAVTVTIVVDVDPTLRQGAVFTNTASVFSQEIQPPLPVTASSATTVTEFADISVQKQDLPDPAGIGGALRYQLRVANAGPSTALNVIVTDTLDINTTFVQATLGFGCVEGPTGRDHRVIPKLLAGASQLIEFDTRVASGLFDGQVITNTVVVASTSTDPNPFNNRDSITTTVRSGTDLSVAKAGQAQVKSGEYLTYTIIVNNLGPSDRAQYEGDRHPAVRD